MILGHIKSPGTYSQLATKKEYEVILTWLKNIAPGLSDGEYPLPIEGVKAVVFTKHTDKRDKAFYEAHRAYIDLHYCLEGEEIIEWTSLENLSPSEPFNEEKDYGKFVAPEKGARILMTAGIFAIFLPSDAHMTNIAVQEPSLIKKIVIKIPTSLL